MIFFSCGSSVINEVKIGLFPVLNARDFQKLLFLGHFRNVFCSFVDAFRLVVEPIFRVKL